MLKNILMLVLLIFSQGVFSAIPKFNDFSVENIYIGNVSPLKEPSSGSENWDAYRVTASHQKVNFAGHYIVFTGGCGGGAICGEVLDVKTGKVVATLPDQYVNSTDEDNEFDIFYKVNSRLIEISGVSSLSNNEYITKYYEFKNDKFENILTDK
jgi:hypothetical protein